VVHETYIKLYRKFLKWEWYSDINTKVLFLHCLLMANYTDQKYKGEIIKAGSFVTGLSKLSAETGMSVQSVRTSLNRLISTNEITKVSNAKGTILTVNNWCSYQSDNTLTNKQLTNNQQTTNKQVTTIKERKKDKKDKNSTNKGNVFAKPSLSEVEAYCQERGNCIDAQAFIDYYDSNGWMVGKNKMKDWKASVRTWESRNGETVKKREMEKLPKQETPKAEVEEIVLEEIQELMGKLGERYG
jgi:hypothetical protein